VFLPRLAPWILQPHPRPSPRSDSSSRCPWLISARGFSQSALVLYLCCLNRSGPSSWCRFSSCSPEVFVPLGLGTRSRSEGCVFFMCLVLRLTDFFHMLVLTVVPSCKEAPPGGVRGDPSPVLLGQDFSSSSAVPMFVSPPKSCYPDLIPAVARFRC
jgi:hypothetical protein